MNLEDRKIGAVPLAGRETIAAHCRHGHRLPLEHEHSAQQRLALTVLL
jgi:hypothetical protein